jgi:hypothetical protein
MKKIVVAYWHRHDLIPYFKHNCVFDYSIEKRNEIVQIIMDSGYSAMLRPKMGEDKDTLLVYIDDGRFGQR